MWLPGSKGERKKTVAALVAALLAVLAATSAVKRTGAPVEAEAPALPLAGWRILVDAGHGGYDGGARAQDSGVWEKEINLAVALRVEEALRAQGAQVFMTRREDIDLCSPGRPAGQTMKRQDMERRVAMAVEAQADMVLSIHMNKYRSRKESGPQVFYREGADGGRLLAGAMQQALNARLAPAKARAAMPGDYFILRLEVPSVLIECGFISHPQEERLLLDAAYQQQVAQAVAQGAAEYARLALRE